MLTRSSLQEGNRVLVLGSSLEEPITNVQSMKLNTKFDGVYSFTASTKRSLRLSINFFVPAGVSEAGRLSSLSALVQSPKQAMEHDNIPRPGRLRAPRIIFEV